MKILLLSGFLGSGKTSTLIQLAKYITRQAGSGNGTKVAIIENEIGKVNIDEALIRSGGLRVTSLFSGCVCCTLGVELITGIKKLHEELAPEFIIIEATGVASPGAIADSVKKYAADCGEIIVITLVDAGRYEILSKTVGDLLTNQIRDADILLLNKIDMAAKDGIKAVEASLREININAELHHTNAAGNIDDSILDRLAGWNTERRKL